MFIIAGQKSRLTEALGDLLKDMGEKVSKELQGIRSVTDLSAKVKSLREELEKLQIEKGRKDEDYARREREIEHKIGLERKRQEQELALAKRESVVSVREENLAADRKRFEEQMAFHEKRFSEEVGYLKTIIGDLAERLPTLDMTADVGKRRR